MDEVEPVYGMYQLAELSSFFLSYPSCQRNCSNSSRLSDGNDTLSSDSSLIQVLGGLSGLSGTCLAWFVRASGVK